VKIWDVSAIQSASSAFTSASASVPSDGAKHSKKRDAKSSIVPTPNVASGLTPQIVAYKTMNVGKLFALKFYPDDPFLLAVGGQKGVVAVWESDEQEVIRARFEGRTVPIPSDYAIDGEGESESGADMMTSLTVRFGLRTETDGKSGGSKAVVSEHMEAEGGHGAADMEDDNAEGFEDLDEEVGERKSEVTKIKKKKKNKKDKNAIKANR
jgi:hypothetical protein